MQLILAIDLKSGMVVHGKSGNRAGYRPLTWGAASSAVPEDFISFIRPRYLYIADLDRIEQAGDNLESISACAMRVRACYVDRGCRSPSDLLRMERIINVIGTETAGNELSCYSGGYLSIDIRDGRALPSGSDPVVLLESARYMAFDGCIILNISSVGTSRGLSDLPLDAMREVYDRPLLYGGGVSSLSDIEFLCDTGFDGAIIATALHHGALPLDLIREGSFC